MFEAAEENYVHDKDFCKMFVLKAGWALPDANAMYTEPEWKLNEFQELKTLLNHTKQKLNDFDLNSWHVHTGKMNPAHQVVNHVRKHVRPEFLTQAWCKFYEIACSSDLVSLDEIRKEGSESFTSVHLCEAPGAFIAALNHYLAINHEDLLLKWLAMTLNPYHESNGHPDIVTDDRLILLTLSNWEFGPDYTGDIFQPGYAEHLYRTAVKQFTGKGAWLVTADGSIDCSDNPGEQETVVSRLHDHETMVALSVLRNSGSLVLKAFTMFECNTICRMFLLCCLFRSVVFRKPATSKPGNSEVYVVCKGYRGRSVAMPYVQAYYANDRKSDPGGASMFPLSLVPNEFRRQLLECAEYFAHMQMRTINANVDGLPHKKALYRGLKSVQASVCEEFMSRLGLRSIQRTQELTFLSENNPSHKHNWELLRNSRKLCGMSYAAKSHMDVGQEACALYRELTRCQEWRAAKRDMGDVVWYNHMNLTDWYPNVVFRMGKPVTEVKSSKFCSEALIHYRHRVLSRFPRVRDGVIVDAECRLSHFRSKIDRPRAVVCDLTDVCNEHASDHTALQHRCLTAIVDALQSLSDGDDLIIIGYPLFTQLSVANIYAVTMMFDTYGLAKPDPRYGHAFVFLGIRSTHRDVWLSVFANVVQYLVPSDNGGIALISWMPLEVLIEQEAYADIIAVNNLCIIHEVEPILLLASSAVASCS